MHPAVLIFVGSGIGGVLRYFISINFANKDLAFPLTTLIINISAALIFGLVFGYTTNNIKFQQYISPLLLVGFCGGFSTFSTFSNELFHLVKTQQVLYAALYISLSVILSVIALYVGYRSSGGVL